VDEQQFLIEQSAQDPQESAVDELPPLAREEQLRDRASRLKPPMPPADPFVLASLDTRAVIRLVNEFGLSINGLVDEKARELDAERGTRNGGDAPTTQARHDAHRWLASLRPDIGDAESCLRDFAEHLWQRTRSRELLGAGCRQHWGWATWELAVEQVLRGRERRDQSHTATAAVSVPALPRVRARPRERRERRSKSSASASRGEPCDSDSDPPAVGAARVDARRAAA
jgi:hypothetical protein